MTLQKIDAGSSQNMLRQLWICADKTELTQATEAYTKQYHPAGYGTRFTEIKECDSVAGVQRYSGQYFTNMSRGKSCD
jgi:hypothetical protein